MSKHANDAAIREQAYYLWEQDGRPHGRENEYWQRATVAVSEKEQLDTLTEAPPRKRTPAKSEPEGKAKAAPKLRAAASKSKAVPAKSGKSADKKPKKK